MAEEGRSSGHDDAARADKAAAIRRAAYSCFAKNGYHGTTVDDICAEAGISKGAFYWHFDSKLEVFLGVLETWASEVEVELERQFHTALTGPDVFAEIAKALQRESHRGRAIMPVWLEFLAHASRADEMRVAIAEFHRRIRDAIARLLMPAFTKTLSEDDVRMLSSTFLGAFIGLVAQQLADPETDFDKHAERIMATMQRLVALLSLEPARS